MDRPSGPPGDRVPEHDAPASPGGAPEVHRSGCVGSFALAAGAVLVALTTLPALLAGCWGAEQVNTGPVGYGFNCHSQECVDEMASLAINAMALALTQIAVLAIALSNRRISAVVAFVGTVCYDAMAFIFALRLEQEFAAYLVLVAVGCALLLLGTSSRRAARDLRHAETARSGR